MLHQASRTQTWGSRIGQHREWAPSSTQSLRSSDLNNTNSEMSWGPRPDLVDFPMSIHPHVPTAQFGFLLAPPRPEPAPPSTDSPPALLCESPRVQDTGAAAGG